MKNNRKGKAVGKKPAFGEDEVRDYLIMNPDFFDLNSDLLSILKPTRRKPREGIIDFQAILLDRLQTEVAILNDLQGSMIYASRSNMTTQARIHAAALCLLEAESYEHLCHIVCNDWVQILQLDSISLCFERSLQNSLPENNNISLIKKGIIHSFLGHESSAILRGNVKAAEVIHGPATPLIRAEALVRLEKTPDHPTGIVAFGSRDETFFTPGQGTELLRFLVAAFQARLKNLLPRPGV